MTICFQDKPPLGLLKPWLYGDARQGFNDVTSGSNAACGTDGFSAASEWVTVRPSSLGSPHFGVG